MTIKEVAKKYGTTIHMLRYYERIGIIPPAGDMHGSQRRYTEQDCDKIYLVRCMNAADLPIDDIVEYIHLRNHGAVERRACLQILVEQRARLLGKAHSLKQMIERMDQEIQECALEKQ